MDHRPQASSLQIPPDLLLRHPELLAALLQYLQPLLALRPTHNFADTRKENIHRRDRFAPLLVRVVQAHIESLDRRGIIDQDHRLLAVLLHQIALVLTLQVAAPLDRIFKPAPLVGLRAQQDLDGLGIGHALELVVDDEGQSLAQRHVVALDHGLALVFVDLALVQEIQIRGAVVERVLYAVLQEILAQVHIVAQIVEGNLWLDHPEFG